MNWLALVALILEYGPAVIRVIVSLFDAIKQKNPEKGSAAGTQGMELAAQIVRSYQTRNDLKNEDKREMAWQDLIVAANSCGINLSETNARTLTQNAYQDVSGK